MIPIQTLFKMMFDNNASDLHLRVGVQPVFRIYGNWSASDGYNKTQRNGTDSSNPDDSRSICCFY